MDPAEVTSGVCEEFRYLLVRLGRQLHRADCEGLMYVHKIPSEGDKADVGLHILSRMEQEGYFEPLHPEKLQEILSKIGRKDLAHYIKEYKQSSMYKKAMKLENEREKESKKNAKKKNKGGWGGGGSVKGGEERRVAARLLSDVAAGMPPTERRWRDMFAVAFTQMAQLVEQMNLLRKTVEEHDRDKDKEGKEGEDDETHGRIEDTILSLVTAQDEVETLSKTLKKAISAAGLKSRRQSQENLIDDPPEAEEPKGMKKHLMVASGSPVLTRANTYHGSTKSPFQKTASAPPPSPATTPATPTTTIFPATPPPIGPIPISPPTVPPDANKDTASTPAFNITTPSSNPNKSKATPPTVRAKPVSKTPEFNRKKMEGRLAAEGTTASSSSTLVSKSALAHAMATHPTSPLAAISTSHTMPAISKTLEKLHKSTPPPNIATATTAVHTAAVAPEVGGEPEHVYDDPNLSKEETEDMYMNSSMVATLVVGATTQLEGVAGSSDNQGTSKQENRISVQMDSGFDQEDDKTWPTPELPAVSPEPYYQNVQAALEEYAKPSTSTSQTPTSQYTALSTTPSSNRR